MDPFELYPRGRLNNMVAKIKIRYNVKSGRGANSSGTGTIIYNCSRTNTVLVLTCGHVVSVPSGEELVRNSKPVYYVCFPDDNGRFNDNFSHYATLLTNSESHMQEIAVLMVKVSLGNKVAAHFRNEPIVQGMPVFTCSNMPPSKHFSHLTGRVNNGCSAGSLFNFDEYLVPTCVEFTLDACGGGSSGSGVFDMDGNILAILVSSSKLFCAPWRLKPSNEDLLAGYTFDYWTHLIRGIPIAPVLEVLKGLIPDFNLELVSTNTTYLADINSNSIPCLPSSSRCLDKHSTPNTPTLTTSHSHPFDPLEGFPWADHCKKAVKIKAHTLFYSGRRVISFGSGTIVAKNEGVTIVLTCGRIVQNFFNYEVDHVDFEVQFCDNETNPLVKGVSNEALVAHLITDENTMSGDHMALLYVEDPLGRGEIARFRERDLVNGMQVVMCANNFENRYSFVTGRVTSRDVKDDEFEFDPSILTYVEYAIATDHGAAGAGLFDLEGNLVAVHVAPFNRTCKVSPPSSHSGAMNLMAGHKIYYAGPLAKGIPIRWISPVLSILCKRFRLNIEVGQDSPNSLLLNLSNYLKDKNSSSLFSKPKYEKPSPSPTQHSKQITSPLPNDPVQTFSWVNLCRTAVRIKIVRPHSADILTGTIIFQHNDITLIVTCGLHVRAYIDRPEQSCTFSIEFSREDGEELCRTPYEATLLSNEEVLRKGIAIFSVKDCCKRKVARFRKNPPLDGMQLLKCAVFYDDCSTFFRTEGRVSSRYVPESGFVEYPVMTRDNDSFGAGLFDIQGDLTAVHVEQVGTACIVDPPISRTSDLGVYRFEIPGRFYRGVPIVLVIEALGYLCKSLGLTIDFTEAAADTMLHGICEYAQSMPTSGGSPFFPPSQPSTEHTRSGKENLCLYGFPSEQWEVPPELPGLALGINFARDGMQSKDWLALGSVHSDAWWRSVAFYFGARRRLFNMINDFPAIFEAVTGNAKKQVKERSTVSNHSCAKSKSSTKSQHPGMKVKHAKEEEGRLDEEPRDTNASDEFWICCDTCETWFHGKCVCEDEAWSLKLRKSSSKNALPCLDKQKISDIDIPDFLDVSGPDFTSLFPC